LRRFLPAVAIAVLATAVVAASASAHEGGRKHRDRDGGGSALPGVLMAEGDGIAAASGKFALRICATEGLLITKGAVNVEEGSYEDTVGGWLGLNVYFGFAGCATIGPEDTEMGSFGGGSHGGSGGQKTAALAVGTGITLEAVGNGIAFLSGEGTWTDALGGAGTWDGGVLKVGGAGSGCGDMEASGGGHGGSGYKKKCPTPTPEVPEEEDDE
jgi:hypothetical protein